MSNDFFNASGTPSQTSGVTSPNVRAEFSAVAVGFDKLPTLTGNAYKITYVNASGTAMDVVGGDGLLKLSTAGVPSVAIVDTDYTNLATLSATAAAVPNNTDLIPVVDTAVTKKLSLTNFKAFLKTYFDTLYSDASVISFTQEGTGAALHTIQDKLSETISIRDFGAVGDGVTDDTTAVQAAITSAYGKTLLFTSGTYLCGPLTVNSSISFSGEVGASLKYKSGTNTSLLTVSGTSVNFHSEGMTFDGNGASHDGNSKTFNFTAIGTSSAPASLSLVRNTFVNGDIADVAVSTDTDLSTVEYIRITGNKFLGGKEGTSTIDSRYLHVSSGVVVDITDNYFDLLATPTTYGRAGIVLFVSGYTGVGSRGNVSGNTLVNVGRSTTSATNGVLGAIDGYYGLTNVSISDNTLITPWGRGIQIKSNATNVAITGNNINGLGDLTAGASVDAQITVNRSTVTDVGGSWVVADNSCYNSSNDGISVSCANTDITGYGSPVLIASNIVKSAVRRGIGLYYAKLATIQDNIIDGGCSGAGIYISSIPTGGTLAIRGNTSSGVSGYDLLTAFNGAEAIDVSDNNFLSTTPFAISGTDVGNIRASNNRTNAASVLNAYSDWNTCTTSQIDWSTGGSTANATVNTCEILSPGTYDITMEGECTSGAGGLALFFSSSATCSYFRGSGQLWNGTTQVDADTMTGSGSPSASLVSYSGACTHYRCKLFMVVTGAGTLLLRGNQNAANAAVTSVYQGATMSVKRLS